MRNLVRAEWDAARGRRGCGRCGEALAHGLRPSRAIYQQPCATQPTNLLLYFPGTYARPGRGYFSLHASTWQYVNRHNFRTPGTHGQKIHTYHRLSKSYLEHNIGDETDKYFPTTDCFKKSGSSTLTSVC